MNNIEFISFIPTPGEKALGIASILYNGLILRFKIIQSEKGGLFVQALSCKVKDPISGEEKWLKAVTIDSNAEHERVDAFIRHHAKIAINSTSARPDLLQTKASDIPF